MQALSKEGARILRLDFQGPHKLIAVMSFKQPRTNLDFPTMTSKMNSDLFKKSSLLIRLHSPESTSKPLFNH